MTAGGWIMMIVSVGGVTAFFGWCMAKVLTTPDSTAHIHSQADIQPPDLER